MKKALFLSVFLASSVFAGELLSSNIPYPFYDVHKASEGKENKLMILDSGMAALQKKLDLINKAQKNIEVEYFIYGTDQSSRLITQALVAAAKRGVKVRMLIDKSAAVFEFDEYYAKALAKHDIQVRYYNSASVIRISSMNFRNHRKLLAVDDTYAITGGRNIEDDYYDMSPKFNFVDRDVLIEGPMATTMRKSFDKFFEDKISERPVFPVRPSVTIEKTVRHNRASGLVKEEADNTKALNKYLSRTKEAEDMLVENETDRSAKNKVAEIAQTILQTKEMHSCPELTFSTDRPGASFWRGATLWNRIFSDRYTNNYRYLRKTLFDKISAVDKKVLISSPYMINNGHSRGLMHKILKKDVELIVYTNSLASTDALYVAANLYKDIRYWVDLDVKVYLHKGTYMDIGSSNTFSPDVKKAKWGTHSKVQIYYDQDYSEIMIGTYNIDNRSNYYNTEMAIFCKGSDSITKELEDSIYQRIDNGFRVNRDLVGMDKDGNEINILGADPDNVFLMNLIALPSWLLKPLL